MTQQRSPIASGLHPTAGGVQSSPIVRICLKRRAYSHRLIGQTCGDRICEDTFLCWINPREVIGLTLKKLGKSYNSTNLQAIPQLKAELTALNQQVKLYSSDSYLQPLLLGNTWLAVGWSTDILPLTQRNPAIAAVVPKAGTALWADLWVRPTVAKPELSALIAAWISFCWRPEIAAQLSLLSPRRLSSSARSAASELTRCFAPKLGTLTGCSHSTGQRISQTARSCYG